MARAIVEEGRIGRVREACREVLDWLGHHFEVDVSGDQGQHYRVWFSVQATGRWQPACSCPLAGRRGGLWSSGPPVCPHVVAVGLGLLLRRLGPLPGPWAPAGDPVAEGPDGLEDLCAQVSALSLARGAGEPALAQALEEQERATATAVRRAGYLDQELWQAQQDLAAANRRLEQAVRRVPDGLGTLVALVCANDCLHHWQTLIREAQEVVRVMAYTFDSEVVTEALLAARCRGVNVCVAVDHDMLHGTQTRKMRPRVRQLLDAGVPVRSCQGTCLEKVYKSARLCGLRGALHAKVLWVDDTHLVVGSSNFTLASQGNQELGAVLRLSDAGVADMVARWASLWDGGSRPEGLEVVHQAAG